jgi:hypothetical protein
MGKVFHLEDCIALVSFRQAGELTSSSMLSSVNILSEESWPLVPLSLTDLENHLSLPVITWMKMVSPAASLVIL